MKIISAMRLLSSVAVLGALVACETGVEKPGIQYEKRAPVTLSVGALQVISVPDAHMPHNRHVKEELIQLRADMENWARDHFAASGGEDKAVLTIEKVNMTVHKKPSEDKYEAMVKVRLDILDERGFVKGSVSADIVQTMGVPYTLTIHEKKDHLKRMGQEMVNVINAKMVKEISQHLVMYLVR